MSSEMEVALLDTVGLNWPWNAHMMIIPDYMMLGSKVLMYQYHKKAAHKEVRIF